MTGERAEKILTWLLYVLGVLAASAVVPAVMPTSWMEAVTRWLDLEPLPRTPLTQYLTRSLSLVYAMLGFFVLYLARDVRRYRELLRFVGWLTAALGVGLIVLDFSIGMPPSWSWGEGPPTVVIGWAMAWLAGRTRPAAA